MRATLQQYLHEFDTSVASLRQLLARPGGDRMAQAWLTLATVLRVQARYAESDAACQRVALAGARLHSAACLAENAALRGDVASARSRFQNLLADPQLPPPTRGWLLTSLAELEQRDGRVAAADAAFKGVLQLGPDSYAAVDYADFLIEQHRPDEALKVLKDETRTDAVLLRLAIAGTRANAPTAARDVAEMRDRIVLANERPDAQKFHGREQAMFALFVDHDTARALQLARGDVGQQREALDVLVFAEAARASGDAGAIDEARRLKASLGLHDRRIDALL
jgi:tetratricopeptide (TPR) repeat protein